jgi:hypothetical protein
MDRAMVLRHLEAAERHVAEGAQHIQRQREIVAKLEADQHTDAAVEARAVLETFLETQEMHEQDRDRILAELGM